VTAVSAVIVSYGHHDALAGTVGSLKAQTRPPVEIIVVDNHPERLGAAALAGTAGVTVLPAGPNDGFAGGCNRGASAARGDVMVLLNPDAEARPDCLERLLEVFEGRPDVGVVGAQVLMPDGVTTNAGHNPVHPTGLSWSGGLHEPAEDGPDRPVLAVSGAALAVRRRVWEQVGGFSEPFFTYVEDTDLCWRVRLAGHDVRYCPRAAVVHDYAFQKRGKWFYLERNRGLLLGRVLDGRTLLLLAPMLLATELAICLVASRSGWWGEKRAAYADLWRRRQWLRADRRRVQALRRVPDAALWPLLSPRISSPLLDGPVIRLANPALALYVRAVGAGIGARG
jgi:GT2 family glycosyltransferase